MMTETSDVELLELIGDAVEFKAEPDMEGNFITIRRRGADGWDTTGPHTGVVEVDFSFPVTIDLTTLTPPA